MTTRHPDADEAPIWQSLILLFLALVIVPALCAGLLALASGPIR